MAVVRSLFEPLLQEFHRHLAGTAPSQCTIQCRATPGGFCLWICSLLQKEEHHIIVSLHGRNMNRIDALSLEEAATHPCGVYVALLEPIGTQETPEAHLADDALMTGSMCGPRPGCG